MNAEMMAEKQPEMQHARTSLPELVTTVATVEQMVRLAQAGADAFRIGEQRYGVRSHGCWTAKQVLEAIRVAHELEKKVYVNINMLLHDEDLDDLPDYVRKLDEAKVDGIIFGDPAVWMVAQEVGAEVPLHFSAEMTTTNYAAINYWGKRGIQGSWLARELNAEQLQSMREGTTAKLFVQAHGATCIYHSRRKLLENYQVHIQASELPDEVLSSYRMNLVERERLEETFPVVQDQHGTHLFSSEDFCWYEVLAEILPIGLDGLQIEGVLMSDGALEATVRAYRAAFDRWAAEGDDYEVDEDVLESLRALQPQGRPFGYGFLFKEQVY